MEEKRSIWVRIFGLLIILVSIPMLVFPLLFIPARPGERVWGIFFAVGLWPIAITLLIIGNQILRPKTTDSKTRIGLKPNVAALLCYFLGFITGFIFYSIEKDNKFVLFHALQSIITFMFLDILIFLIRFIPFIGIALSIILGVLRTYIWIVLMVKAYRGEYFKLPIAGAIAEKKLESICNI
jgi:uncharacterized membrane protein